MFESLLVRLARALDRAEVPYMVIGGQALLIYAEPRLTRDIDITLGVGTDRLSAIRRLLADLNLSIVVSDPVDFVERNMVLPALEAASGIRVDFMFSNSAYERAALGRARSIEVGGYAGGWHGRDFGGHALCTTHPRMAAWPLISPTWAAGPGCGG